MNVETCNLSLEQKLIDFIDSNDINNIEFVLKEGANAARVTSNGRSAIGHAANKGLENILRMLLRSCEENDECSEPKKLKAAKDETPDGMEDLQWEEEIQNDFSKCDETDEGSKLYVYYAQIFEKTGELLSNAIKKRDPHCLDRHRFAPIHYAAMNGNVACTELLLEYDSPVDITTNCGFTPLMLAVKYPDVVECLLKRKADPNKNTNGKQETALHVCCRIGTPEVIPLLIDAGACINKTCLTDSTPLILAISNSNFEIANVLIDRGANVNIQDKDGETPLSKAVLKKNLQLVERLLELGARLLVNHYSLHYCAKEGLLDIMQVLIKYGSNIDLPNAVGWTPLIIATSVRQIKIFKFLIENGAKLSGSSFNELHLAIFCCGNLEEFKPYLQAFLSRGFDIDTLNGLGETGLQFAIINENYEMAAYLIKEGADVNISNGSRNCNCLSLAKYAKNIDLLKLLVFAGLKISSKDRPKSLKPPPGNDSDFEQYYTKVCFNTLPLQQLARISIRNRIIENTKQQHKVIQLSYDSNSYGSMIKYAYSLLGLPKTLERYLYDFPDVPLMSYYSKNTLPTR